MSPMTAMIAIERKRKCSFLYVYFINFMKYDKYSIKTLDSVSRQEQGVKT